MNVNEKSRVTPLPAQEIWQAALDQLQRELNRGTFDTWLRGATLLAYKEGTFVIGVTHAYARDWLENRLQSTVKRILCGIAGHTVEVSFAVETPIAQPTEAAQELDAAPGVSFPPYSTQSNLNAKYVFETFVVGPSNQLAHAACQAVADSPARVYNPVFLYGGVGLGKTHLLLAVGNTCAGRGLQVLYVSSEEFTNDLITSIQKRTTEAFRNKYRRIDVLLVDDIQFIAGKESTQEEFFHTFNTLYGQDKQVVMTSDRPPKAMVTLEERLRSRFEWGLSVDIQPPDFETRQAILRSKANRAGRQVDSAVIELIARQVQSNIRELEGALTRVMAYADLLDQPITLEIANSALTELLPRRRSLTALQVLQTVADYFNSTFEILTGRDRTKETAWARQVAMYLIREETESSLPTIGEILGRDHTTVMYGCDKVAELVERDDAVRREVIAVREKLYQQR
jgi:chromosomal replication initiator protein